MKLPNGHVARVDLGKIGEYLLDEEHPTGRAKATFFRGLGFDHGLAGLLAVALTDIAREGEVTSIRASTFSTKYVVDGTIIGPGGRRTRLRTVWISEHGVAAPRFVTEYPAPAVQEENQHAEGA